MKLKLFIFILLLLSLFLGVGKLLDLEDERVIQQFYFRDKDGVINGLQSIVVDHHHDKALVLIHGFLQSPTFFKDLIDDLKQNNTFDIYAPLLPYHGQNLQQAKNFNNEVIVNYIKQYIDQIAKQYKTVTVVGYSYGGVVLVQLASQQQLPKNINLVLYAPGLFVQTNNLQGNLILYSYGLWRDYCNYDALGCGSPVYDSGDEAAKPLIDKEVGLRYEVIPAIKQLYKFDSQNRDALAKITIPYDLIIATDDNRISYEALKLACMANQPYCHFYPFTSGKHLLHWGKRKKEFEALLLNKIVFAPNAA